jgi:hypothetical protein
MGFSGDSFVVRIESRIVEALLKQGFQFRSQEVLHLLGGLVHVIRSNVHGLVEVEFPKSVETDDSHGIRGTGSTESNALSILQDQALLYKCL